MKHIEVKCTGSQFSNDKDSIGGHVEDYIVDPNHKPNYPRDMRWVPVSQTFKKD